MFIASSPGYFIGSIRDGEWNEEAPFLRLAVLQHII